MSMSQCTKPYIGGECSLAGTAQAPFGALAEPEQAGCARIFAAWLAGYRVPFPIKVVKMGDCVETKLGIVKKFIDTASVTD